MASWVRPLLWLVLLAGAASVGLTQEQLALRIRVSFTSVNHWERGRRRPIPIALDKIKTLAEQAQIDLAAFTEAEEGGR